MKRFNTVLYGAFLGAAFLAMAAPAAAVPVPVVCPAAGTTVDLTTASATTTINDAIYTSADSSGSVGTGVFPAFVKINGNDTCISGYNTDGTLEFDTSNSPLIMFTLDTMDVVSQGGTDYFEFILDINQEKNDPLLSLDNVQIFYSTSSTLTGWSDCKLDNDTVSTADDVQCVYSMDAGTNRSVLLNYTLNNGSGNGFDMSLLVPTSAFAGVVDPSATYVYLYSAFGSVGGAYAENDGPEEWAYRRCPEGEVCFVPPPPPDTNVPEPSTLVLLAAALAGAVGSRRRARRIA
jgi:hypothetical protein